MATLLEHVYAIHNIQGNGPISDDNPYSDKLVAHLLKNARSILLKRKLDKYNPISELSYQILCVPMELSKYADCSCIPSDLNCTVLRSTCKLPKDIVLRYGTSIQVKYIDGRVISQSSPTQNSYAMYSLANNLKRDSWFIEDGYLYILNNKKIPLILAKAVWEDPEDVERFCSCAKTLDSADLPCVDTTDKEFPIDADLVTPMYEMVLQMLEHSSRQIRDTENNAKAQEASQGTQ